ncbi:hypothetical protein GH714_010518 [Hevea brasiliensis]|uniref:C2H2-type domain-containing protein n=1 Tax=Hevea brasiliensis TaxID=3981 RepID=A0A6A6MT65_HEVBR|nr:hypothetical protein GH714_010518 [Hevea brasiliensis]
MLYDFRLCAVSILLQAKPNSNLCGAKRKAATPPEQGAVGLPDAGLKKIPKEEWNCALCNVSATSEEIGAYSAVVMEAHEKGKKHKFQLQQLHQNGEAVPAITTMVSSKAGEKAKDREAVTVEANEKRREMPTIKKKQQKLLQAMTR